MNVLQDDQTNLSPVFLNLPFDEHSERQIRQLQHEIELAGISTAYSTGLFQGALRPHISLTAYSVEDPDQWDDPLHRLLTAKAAFPLILDALGLFIDRGVIFFAPRISTDLLSLKSAIDSLFQSAGLVPRSPNFLSVRFHPHCTLVPHSTGEQTLNAIAICRKHWQPLQPTATGVQMLLPHRGGEYKTYSFHR